MKTLKDYIAESSILDIEGTLNSGKEVIKKSIKEWIKGNFYIKRLKISDNPNSDGKYEISAVDVNVKNKNITSLTNGMFVWNIIIKDFYCTYCDSLTSLEGAPKEVGMNFCCYNCDNLKSLKGAPEKVGEYFNCSSCHSLTSLEGAPKEVGGYFDCSYCKSLTSLEGAPKEIGTYFSCSNCPSLKSKDLPVTTKVKYVMHD